MYVNDNKANIARWLIVIFLVYLAVHPFLTAWIGSSTGYYAPVKVVQDIFVILLLIPASIYVARNRSVGEWVVRDKLSWLIIAYGLLHLGLLLVFHLVDSKAGIAGIIFNLRFLVVFLCLRIFLYDRQAVRVFLLASISKAIIGIGTLLALFAIIQVTVLPGDFLSAFGYDGVMAPAPFSTVDNRADTLRAFGTLQGPNELGAYLLLPFCLAMGYLFIRRRIIYGLCAALIGVAVILTYSRSAILAAMIALVVVLLSIHRQYVTKRKLVLAMGIVVLLIGGLLMGVMASSRLQVFVFHSSREDPSIFEGSTNDHLTATVSGVQDVLSHPFGHGPGQAGPAAFYTTDEKPRIAENYFIQLAQEVGLAGLVLFAAICALVVRGLIVLKKDASITGLVASFIGISITCLLLHTWTTEAVAYTWWILAAVALAENSYTKRRDGV